MLTTLLSLSGFWTAVAGIGGSLVTGIVGMVAAHYTRNNQVDMITTAQAQKDAAQKKIIADAIAHAEATGDLTKVRELLAL
jgi:hypothetical protein